MILDPGTDLVTLLRAVVDIESVSGNEKRLADLVEEVLRTQPHLEVARDGDCVVARTRLGRAQRVLIAGHLDTVPVAGNLPSTVEETPEGIVIHGRGTVDMKGGVAVALKLACELDRPRFDITWVFYDHEEVDASLNGLGRLAGNRPDLLEADSRSSWSRRGPGSKGAAREPSASGSPSRAGPPTAPAPGWATTPFTAWRTCSRGSRPTNRNGSRWMAWSTGKG